MPNRFKTYGGVEGARHYYEWYHRQHKNLKKAKTMAEKQQALTDAKLDMLNKLNNIQRSVISLSMDSHEREIKNLNRDIDAVNSAYNNLTLVISQE